MRHRGGILFKHNALGHLQPEPMSLGDDVQGEIAIHEFLAETEYVLGLAFRDFVDSPPITDVIQHPW